MSQFPTPPTAPSLSDPANFDTRTDAFLAWMTTIAAQWNSTEPYIEGDDAIFASLSTTGAFTSLGIDDNAASTAMTLDSSGNVGIGTSSPSGLLDVSVGATKLYYSPSSDNSRLYIKAGFSTKSSEILFENNTDAGYGGIDYDHAIEAMRFDVNSSEAMRIDSSGNVLVGKTSLGIENSGVELREGAASAFTRDDTVLNLNRLSTDGEVLRFRKDGATVGSIGAKDGDMFIGTGDTGLRFNDGSNQVYPTSTATGTSLDATIGLGHSGGRFKDLYLSGGVYLGGTGSANKLDDYEEGTWTPSYTSSSTPSITYDSGERSASYTKVGNIVFFMGTIRTDGVSGGSGSLTISGLPFATATGGAERPLGMQVTYQAGWGTYHPTSGYANSSETVIRLQSSPHNADASTVQVSDMQNTANSNFMMFYGQYRTDA